MTKDSDEPKVICLIDSSKDHVLGENEQTIRKHTFLY